MVLNTFATGGNSGYHCYTVLGAGGNYGYHRVTECSETRRLPSRQKDDCRGGGCVCKAIWKTCMEGLPHQASGQRDGPRAAGVYSLITKDNFNDKPSRDDYNKAFHDLTHDFKSRTFSTLICSPLGCVRDHVKIEHFAKNINEFHQTTGAKVVVVTKEQSTARRVLHHGLSHAVFVRKLKEEIKKAGSADTPATKDLGTSQSVPVSTQSSFNLNSFHLHCSDFPPLTVPTKSLQAPLTPGKNPSSCLNSLVPQQTPPC
ncbi:hypothetical protein J6590_010713 [Homalodisca vitripennis]|nr:hypothetical protein J6590_010713 [Homalodisca vitripennis]